MIRIVLPLALTLGLTTAPAMAAGSFVPVGADQETEKECGACHIAYPPEMLPVRSWQRIMGHLANHFGENAAIPKTARTDIEAYLVANAGDTPGAADGPLFVNDLSADATPLRVTDTPFWKRLHSEIPPSTFAGSQIKSKSNCIACHIMAGQGQFGE